MVNSLETTFRKSIFLNFDGQYKKVGLCFSNISFECLKNEMPNFLHEEEISHYENLKFPKRQFSYLVGRYCSKNAIAAYTGDENFTNACIVNGIFCQPVVSHNKFQNIQVSISHANLLGGAIVFPEAFPMAIDIENIHSKNIDIIQSQLTENEKKIFSLLNIDNLTILWTAKEALSKALKCGLMIDFELLEIDSISNRGHFFYITFKNFVQYEVMSFKLLDNYCSILYPKKTTLDINLETIFETLNTNEI
ncbi:MAG: 4'-phosphopantetheinyl transferase superfamily protein [Parachlamydiaceae bacterium]|nr:4'-phosphopantetheinyl transferase superfamily protein [Parachlamydiaceae bacterium]